MTIGFLMHRAMHQKLTGLNTVFPQKDMSFLLQVIHLSQSCNVWTYTPLHWYQQISDVFYGSERLYIVG